MSTRILPNGYTITHLLEVGGMHLAIQELSKVKNEELNFNEGEFERLRKILDPIHCDMLYRIFQTVLKHKGKGNDIFEHGIGNDYDCSVMIVGEVIGKEKDFLGKPNIRAFTDPNKHSSSYFLHKALSLTKNPMSYYITNARKSANVFGYDQQKIIQEINLIRPKSIITLGKTADKYFRQLTYRIPTTNIPHPSWVRRFNAMSVEEYANLLNY